MALKELRNSIDGTSLSVDNFKAIWKKHIQEYWIIPDEEGLVDLKLDIVGDETLRADNDVTDHYVESNKAYQDQITHRPKVYTINGEVGELVWYQRDKSAQVLGQVAQKLEGVISFLPVRSKGFNQMKKNIMKASQWVDTASNSLTKLSTLVGKVKAVTGLGTLGTKESLTHQEQSYILLLWIRDNNKPINIKTPWGVLNGYVITNLEFRQPKETKDKTYISITFKEFRTTSIRPVEFDENKYQGNAALENQPKEDQGKTAGQNDSISQPVTKNDQLYRVYGVDVAGDYEKAVVRVDVTDEVNKYHLYYGTGNRFNDSRLLILDDLGKRVTDKNLTTQIVKASEKELTMRVEGLTSGFVGE